MNISTLIKEKRDVVVMFVGVGLFLFVVIYTKERGREISLSNSTNGVMEVKLVAAKGLKPKDFFDKIDPYVVIRYRDQVQMSRIARGQGGKQVWNEEFKFRVQYPATGTDDRNYNYKLLLQIMDHHSFTPDHDLGQTTIYLKEVFERGVEEGEAELGVQKYRVVSADLTYNGEIQVGVTFTTKVEA